MERKLILAINPGSTSTKIALFDGYNCLYEETIRHYLDDLMHYPTIVSQFDFRRDLIMGTLEMSGFDASQIAIVMGRGGLTYPLKSGVYEIDDRMLVHVRRGILGQHASNLGPLLAYSIAKDIPGAKAYIADPVVTDELDPIARIAGHPRFERLSIFHALNQKAVSRLYAQKIKRKYESLNLIVAHMGGGVSVGAHCCGRVIDVNNALDGDGPFSPERSGTLPAGQLISVCLSQTFSEEEIREMVTGEGGLVAYLQTNSMIDAEKMAAEGDSKAQLIIEAFAYQVSKSIGEMATVLKGKVDAIILTGGIAHSKTVVSMISERVGFIAPIEVNGGEDEMAAMALNANLMLAGELVPMKYPH
jgi:butyrate kinase